MSLGKRALVVASVNAAGALAGLLLHVFLARLLGVSEYGTYAYIVSLATLLGTLSLRGFDTASIRFIASYKERLDGASLAAFRRFATSQVLIGGVCVALGWLAVLVLTGNHWQPHGW